MSGCGLANDLSSLPFRKVVEGRDWPALRLLSNHFIDTVPNQDMTQHKLRIRPPVRYGCRLGGSMMLLVVCFLPGASLAAGAARIDFAIGDVAAVRADGVRRSLARGAEVHPGETVDTGSGRTQLRFTDGGMVSLQPQTQFRIDAYEFKGQPDGSEKGFFSLLKGAMRTITGAIGKAERKAYRLDTAVATIGIRGTEYAVAYGNSITVTTNSGLIEVCNSAGCLLVEAGQSAYVPDANTPPAYTRRNALDPLLAPPGPATPGFSSSDAPGVITPPAPQPPSQDPPYQPPPYQGGGRLQGPYQ